MAIGTLRRGDFADGMPRFKGDLLGRSLIVGIAKSQTAVAPFSTGAHTVISVDDEGTVLAGFTLESNGSVKKNMTLSFLY